MFVGDFDTKITLLPQDHELNSSNFWVAASVYVLWYLALCSYDCECDRRYLLIRDSAFILALAGSTDGNLRYNVSFLLLKMEKE